MIDKILLKSAKRIIEILIVILIIISLCSVIYIIEDASRYGICLSKSECFVNFINLFDKYSSLYSSTFIVIASYYTINQLNESKKVNTNAIKQANISLEDIKIRTHRESINKTVDVCKYFYDEIQPQIKKLYKKLNESPLSKIQINWNIEDFTEESIKEQDAKWNESFENLGKTNFELYSEIILVINKLEIFAINFIDGLADNNVGFNSIGHEYCRQIQVIYPLISVWRSRDKISKHNYYEKIVDLYVLWKEQIHD